MRSQSCNMYKWVGLVQILLVQTTLYLCLHNGSYQNLEKISHQQCLGYVIPQSFWGVFVNFTRLLNSEKIDSLNLYTLHVVLDLDSLSIVSSFAYVKYQVLRTFMLCLIITVSLVLDFLNQFTLSRILLERLTHPILGMEIPMP